MPGHLANGQNQDRLRDHAKAFDGLLSLIPAKLYYGEDTSVRERPIWGLSLLVPCAMPSLDLSDRLPRMTCCFAESSN